LGSTPAEFVAACDAALATSPEERDRRAALMRKVLSGTSWDVTVSAMEELVAEAMAKNADVRVSA
jgi:hypothetical protein